ncbi:hypothetical protein HanXRQr2_Chr06g0271081 [Helianthus annuus]|uniref:Uncharacterized protein n=1 Tax=Helianthus annuus TaxID=4232 RepID=A0A9K3IUV0_HELAN|nr:hypothetical protein HanXRQr2_Chr06g0271081 [Helianthus annuus]KAJ0916433.1 hypothetical protein HanPSC8_Chr06g0261631 [Helianthus annuus]
MAFNLIKLRKQLLPCSAGQLKFPIPRQTYCISLCVIEGKVHRVRAESILWCWWLWTSGCGGQCRGHVKPSATGILWKWPSLCNLGASPEPPLPSRSSLLLLLRLLPPALPELTFALLTSGSSSSFLLIYYYY